MKQEWYVPYDIFGKKQTYHVCGFCKSIAPMEICGREILTNYCPRCGMRMLNGTVGISPDYIASLDE